MLIGSDTYRVEKVLITLTALIWVTSLWNVYNNYIIWICAAYAIYTGRQGMSKLAWRDVTFFLPVILFFVYVTGLLWSDDLFVGYKQVEKRIVLGIFPLIFFFLRNKLIQLDITYMLYVFVFFCIAISFICCAYAAWQSVHYGSLKVVGQLERSYYYFSYKHLTQTVRLDPIYVSLYINFAIIIILFRPFKNKALTVIMLIYFLLFNVLVASKAGIIGLFVIFALYLLGRVKNKFIAVSACILIMALLIWAVESSKFLRERFLVSTQFNYELPWLGDWNSTSQRLAIWTCAVETIEKTFPFGSGTSDGQQALNKTYKLKNYVRGYEDEYNAHSEYLYTLLDTGVFGLAALLLIFVWPAIRSIKYRDSLFMYFLILIFFYFFVETVLARRAGLVFFSFFYSLLVLNGLMEQPRPKPTTSDEI